MKGSTILLLVGGVCILLAVVLVLTQNVCTAFMFAVVGILVVILGILAREDETPWSRIN